MSIASKLELLQNIKNENGIIFIRMKFFKDSHNSTEIKSPFKKKIMAVKKINVAVLRISTTLIRNKVYVTSNSEVHETLVKIKLGNKILFLVFFECSNNGKNGSRDYHG